MSLATLLTKEAPKLGGGKSGIEVIEFDVVYEETLDATVEVSTYPIESGALASDHIIIQPRQYRLSGAISNNPISPQITDFAGGVVSNFTDGSVAGGVIAGAAGLSAGLLGGDDGNRARAALDKLLKLMTNRKSFTYNTDDLILTNMVITSVSRTRTAQNENALEFELSMQELPTVDAIIQANSTNPTTNLDDAASTQSIDDIDKGEVRTQTPTASGISLGDQI